MNTTNDTILYATRAHIATITINRASHRNALTQAMYVDLAAALNRAAADATVHVALLTGAAGYFTAGNDLADFTNANTSEESAALIFLQTLEAFPKPIVAAVERGAVGIGTTLLQHCDFVYAGRGTRFSLPFINFGLCAEGGASRILAHGPAARQAARWLMLGEPFTAEEALAAGLLTSVTDDDAACSVAEVTAAKLALLSPEALRTTKAQIRKARPNMAETLADEIDEFTRLLKGDGPQQAVRAVVERLQKGK